MVPKINRVLLMIRCICDVNILAGSFTTTTLLQRTRASTTQNTDR